MSAQNSNSAIAVIGMACRLPGARDVDRYWSNLLEGSDFLAPLDASALRSKGVPRERYAREGHVAVSGAVDGVEEFDSSFFGIAPAEADAMDPQHRLFLEEAVHALEDAGWAGRAAGGRVGVFCGSGENRYGRLLPAPEEGAGSHRRMSDAPAMLPLRVSYHLDLRGPSVFVNTLCSTGLTAVHLARQSLLAGDCDIALAGAVSLQLPHEHGYLAGESAVLSPDGTLRPFDRAANGTVPGSGVGIVVLRPLADALRNGDRVHAVLHGTAVNNDGSDRQSFAAPSVAGQRDVILAAVADAGVDPRAIGYVEAHGTGTPLGDPVELAALREARERLGVDTPCAIGAVKSSIGHLDTAAGMAGLIKAVLSVREGVIPATAHHRELLPSAGIEGSGLYVNTRLREWPDNGQPRCAGVSALGVGGTNAHVVVGHHRAAPGPQDTDVATPAVFPVSARSADAFHELRRSLADALTSAGETASADVARTLQDGRMPRELRRAWVASSLPEAAVLLKDEAAPVPAGPLEVALDLGSAVRPGPSLTDRIPALATARARPDATERAFLTAYAALDELAALGVRVATITAHGAGEYLAAAHAGALDRDVALRCAVRHEAVRAVVRDGGDLSACETHLAAMEDDLRAHPPTRPESALRSLSLGETVPAGTELTADHFLDVAQSAVMDGGPGAAPRDAADLMEALASWQDWLELAAWCWERGADLDWGRLRAGSAHVVALPGYPFHPRRHWAIATPDDAAAHPDPASGAKPVPVPVSVSVPAEGSQDVVAVVTDIWRSVLGEDDIAPDSDFFALGGHSLVAAQIVARLRERFGVNVSVGDLLDAETPEAMAALVREQQTSAALYSALTAPHSADPTGSFEL
ncbi:beta-ketoacyl synthase N-terminal-like domain-containing protein [Streptomyces sp. NPDC060232]|uniref:beta-ketoacyl synthase N-terminal-like domain-containing protein n=1 Tax=Streptomyces sp. NPDC060232 TaxID=3347079 RepID=UPI00364903BD